MSRVLAASSRSSSARAAPRSPEDAYAWAMQIATSRCCAWPAWRPAAVVALLVLEPRQEPVELVALEVELGQAG